MKIKIDKNGLLSIERRGKFKSQYCPYSSPDSHGELINCGDHCPQFSEPDPRIEGETTLYICDNKAIFFDEFIDERRQSWIILMV